MTTGTRDALAALQPIETNELHGLDTETEVFFYEQDFYVLSNFSAFNLQWKGITFPTSEHAYHWEKFGSDDEFFSDEVGDVLYAILSAPSAHEAFKIAECNKALRRPDWDAVKVEIMHDILRAKAAQHEYVRRKLLATGDRCLIENSWRDDFWGWGPNRDGKNMLGTLWMRVRAELRPAAPPAPPQRTTEFCWLVEEFRRDGSSTGRYMASQVDFTITADPGKAKRLRRQLSAEMRAAEMPRDAFLGTGWRAVEHGFEVVQPPQRAAQEAPPAFVYALRGLLASLSRDPTEQELRAAAHEFTVRADRLAAARTHREDIDA